MSRASILLRKSRLVEGQDEADELRLYINNDTQLYRQRFIPILKNMDRKKKAGKFDDKLAVKGFMVLVNDGAKKYVKEFGSPGDTVDSIFDKKTRELVAKEYVSELDALIADDLGTRG